MLFELHNPATERVSHCGVLEFIADEGMIYLPYWVGIVRASHFSDQLGCLAYCCCKTTKSCNFLFCSMPVDDGKHALTRGRHCKSQECHSFEGNICEAAAPYNGLLGYF